MRILSAPGAACRGARGARLIVRRRLGRREMLRGLAAGLGAVGRPAWLRAEESAYEAMARAALAFLGALDSRRRRQATFPFAHAERQNWHYVPRRREGVPLKDMAADARTAALALLQVGLSAAGWTRNRRGTVAAAPRRRHLLSSRWRRARDVRRLHAGSGDNYAVTICRRAGAPRLQPWGWRFEVASHLDP